MKQFIQTEFFRLLQNNSPDDNPARKLEDAYEEFVGMLLAKSNMPSLLDYRNALCYARVEFSCLQNQGEMKKK
jgi:hypothetical protein